MATPTARSVPDGIDDVDLSDPRTFAECDLSGYWRALRADSPVHRHPGRDGAPPFWVVTRHADILRVYRDTEAFTSSGGNVLEALLAGGDPAGGRAMEVTDGPRHRALRAMLSPAFSARALDRHAGRVRENARRRLAEAVGRGDEVVDLVADVAGPVATATLGDLLGVPEHDREHVSGLTRDALASDVADDDGVRATMARHGLMLYFIDLVDERRRAPRDDVISLLSTGEVDGEPLTDEEVVLNCYSLVLGSETDRLAMIDAVVALADHPDQWRTLRGGGVPVERAAEEVLRWSSPTVHFGRTAVRDVEVAGTRIGAGDIVTLWSGSGNRDETVFDDPDRFDLARTPNRHLTFGQGPHFCIGARLARIEVSQMLAALCETVAEIEIAAPPAPIYSTLLAGLGRVPVRLSPAVHRDP